MAGSWRCWCALSFVALCGISAAVHQADAQCAHGRSPGGIRNGLSTASVAGTFSPLAYSNRMISSANGYYQPMSAMAQQTYLMNQLYRQQLILEQLQRQANRTADAHEETDVAAPSTSKDAAKKAKADRLREQRRARNAEQALRTAELAERKGQATRAKTFYRRAAEIVPESPVAEQARAALDRLARSE